MDVRIVVFSKSVEKISRKFVVAPFAERLFCVAVVPTPPGGIHYVEVQGDSAVVSVETAIGFAETHNSAGAIVPPPGMFAQGNVVFVAGVTDGYLLVDADNSGTFGGPNDFAIVLDHLNNTTLFGPGDVI
jgi:hypothetical protein